MSPDLGPLTITGEDQVTAPIFDTVNEWFAGLSNEEVRELADDFKLVQQMPPTALYEIPDAQIVVFFERVSKQVNQFRAARFAQMTDEEKIQSPHLVNEMVISRAGVTLFLGHLPSLKERLLPMGDEDLPVGTMLSAIISIEFRENARRYAVFTIAYINLVRTFVIFSPDLKHVIYDRKMSCDINEMSLEEQKEIADELREVIELQLTNMPTFIADKGDNTLRSEFP